MAGIDHRPSGASTTVITDARTAASAEMSSRIRRYSITMAFRTACFLAMIWAEGPLRWVLFACAVFLPYMAVLAANQAKRRGAGAGAQAVEASDVPQLTTGFRGDLITGHLGEDEEPRVPRDRVA
jgi:hypothetical protein